jgi:hypothetical protein
LTNLTKIRKMSSNIILSELISKTTGIETKTFILNFFNLKINLQRIKERFRRQCQMLIKQILGLDLPIKDENYDDTNVYQIGKDNYELIILYQRNVCFSQLVDFIVVLISN